MACIPAPACVLALTEATAMAPNRGRASDGICASLDHRIRSPISDHNDGNAWDVTHDPDNGCDAGLLLERIRERKDPRVKYAIFNSRIWSPSHPFYPYEWRPYFGSNPHRAHGHVSIKPEFRDDRRLWWPELHKEEPMTAEQMAELKAHIDSHLAAATPPVGYEEGSLHWIVRARNAVEIGEDRLLAEMSAILTRLDVPASPAGTAAAGLAVQVTDELARRLGR